MYAASGVPGDNAVERYALFLYLSRAFRGPDGASDHTATRARARLGRSPGGHRHGRTQYRALFRQPPVVRQGAITVLGLAKAALEPAEEVARDTASSVDRVDGRRGRHV